MRFLVSGCGDEKGKKGKRLDPRFLLPNVAAPSLSSIRVGFGKERVDSIGRDVVSFDTSPSVSFEVAAFSCLNALLVDRNTKKYRTGESS